MKQAIHINEARRIMDSGAPFSISLWKIETGEEMHYDDVICISSHLRGGTRKVKFQKSGEIRELRDVCIFSINGQEVYL